MKNSLKKNEYYKLFSGSKSKGRFSTMFGLGGVMPYAYLERVYMDNPEVIEFLESLVEFYPQKRQNIHLAQLFLEDKFEKKLCRIPVDENFNTIGSSRLKNFLLGSHGYGEIIR